VPDILQDIEKKLFLNFGGYNISPVSAVSVAMILDYMQATSGPRQPFVINFPNKDGACVPLTAGILINFFFNDYVYYQRTVGIRKELTPGKRKNYPPRKVFIPRYRFNGKLRIYK
jgi:hypothetical protein